MDCSLPDSSVHGILQARILEWVAMSFFRGSSWFRDWTCVSHVYVLLWFSHQVVSDSLRPCELQHARFPCPSLPPWVCSKSCPLSQWCYPIILSSVTLFSSFLQSFPASGSFLANQHFASDDQSIGASASALPMNIQGWFPLGMTFFELLPIQRTLKSLLQRHSSKPSVLASTDQSI